MVQQAILSPRPVAEPSCVIAFAMGTACRVTYAASVKHELPVDLDGLENSVLEFVPSSSRGSSIGFSSSFLLGR